MPDTDRKGRLSTTAGAPGIRFCEGAHIGTSGCLMATPDSAAESDVARALISSSEHIVSLERLVPVEKSTGRQGSTQHDIKHPIGIGVVAAAGPGRIGFDDRPPV